MVSPALFARMRLFGLLAVLGPLFGGLNVLVLESVPRVEIRLVAADTPPPAADVVTVEKVVERVVYVPVDNLSIPEPVGSASQAAGPTDGEAGQSVADAPEGTPEPTPTASELEAESVPDAPVIVRRAPVVPASASVADEVAEDEQSDEAEAETAEAPTEIAEEQVEEPAATPTPRVIVVHTMVWDGEQFVESNEGTPTIIEVRDPVASEPEPEPDPVQAAEGNAEPAGEGDGEQTQITKSADESGKAVEASDEPAPMAETGGDAEPVADQSADEAPVADASTEGQEVPEAEESEVAQEAAQVAGVGAEVGAELMQAVGVYGQLLVPQPVTDDSEQAASDTESPEGVADADGDPDHAAENEAESEAGQAAVAADEQEEVAESEGGQEEVATAEGDQEKVVDAGDEPERAAGAAFESEPDQSADGDDLQPDTLPTPRARVPAVESIFTPVTSD